MIKPTKKFKLFRLENAQTMVEFALVFPIVLLITYGIIEFGRMLWIYSAVTSSAREGARYGAAAGIGPNGVIQYADCTGIRTAVQKTAILIPISNLNIFIHYDKGPVVPPAIPITVASTCETLRTAVASGNDPIKLGNRIVVTVIAQYEPLIGGFLGVSGFPINSLNARTILKDIEFIPNP